MALCPLRVARPPDRLMAVAQRGQRLITTPPVGSHQGPIGYAVGNERGAALRATPKDNPKSKAARMCKLLERHSTLVLLPVFSGSIPGIFPLSNFERPNDRRLVMHATPFAACAPAHKAFVNFDRRLATDAITLWPYHARAEFVQDWEGCFIAGQPKLPLELKG